MEYKAVDVVIL